MTVTAESYTTSSSSSTAGRVVRVTGPVVDVEFPRGAVPELTDLAALPGLLLLLRYPKWFPNPEDAPG